MSLAALGSWFRRSSKHQKLRPIPDHLRHLQPGQYAGVAIYRPRDRRDLKPELYAAIGKAFHLSYTCLAEPGEPYAGQMLFQEQKARSLRSWLPEEDLEFVTASPSAAGRTPAAAARPSQATVRTPARTLH